MTRRLPPSFDAALVLLRLAPAAVALSVLTPYIPLARLARWAWRPARMSADASTRDAVVSRILQIGRWIGLPDRDCVQRSLLVYRELSRLGRDPELVVGFRRRDGRLEGHAWVVDRGSVFLEGAEELAGFTPALRFGAEGMIVQ